MGNNPVNGIDPDGGFFGEIKAAWSWVKSGFQGWIGKNSLGEWQHARSTGKFIDDPDALPGSIRMEEMEIKNFGLGGLGRLEYNTAEFSMESKIDFGLQDVSDKGVKGHSIKLVTTKLVSSKVSFYNNGGFNPKYENDYFLKDGKVKGNLASISVEAGRFDIKSNIEYELSNWQYTGYINVPYIPTNAKFNGIAGLGAPYIEAKIKSKMNQKTLHIGLQEDFGKSITYNGLGFGGKVNLILQGTYTWKY
jgi:hypothetical protein